jgi:hypothetical protein
MPINLSLNYKNILLISATIFAGFILLNGVGIISSAHAQPNTQKITLTMSSTKLAQSANDTTTRLKAVVGYVTNDASLINTKVNGIMKVSSLNGTSLKTSSFANGFSVNKSGTITFTTSLPGKSIHSVRVDVGLTDLEKITQISNVVNANVNLDVTPIASKKASSNSPSATKSPSAPKPLL